jgi:predicted metal-dependent phosphoesterase TrpH
MKDLRGQNTSEPAPHAAPSAHAFSDGNLSSYSDDEIDGVDPSPLQPFLANAVRWHQEFYHHPDQCRGGWDLHCHTVFSDGHASPTQALHEAHDRGLGGIAIADHDSAAGWSEAEKASQAIGEPLMRGTEVTAQWETKGGNGGHPLGEDRPGYSVSVHLLAWLYDPSNPQLSELFAQTRRNRIIRTRRMVERLSHDYPITWESVQAQAHHGDLTTIGRPHIADALVAAGCFPTRSAAFAGPVSSGSKYYIPVQTPSADDVIRAVKGAGGVICIAHPASLSRNPVILSDADIEYFATLGLDGLEVWHRENSPQQRLRLISLADQLSLIATGGSDWHGQGGKPNRMGENQTDPATVRLISDRGTLPIL